MSVTEAIVQAEGVFCAHTLRRPTRLYIGKKELEELREWVKSALITVPDPEGAIQQFRTMRVFPVDLDHHLFIA